jgi:hypothetical protein
MFSRKEEANFPGADKKNTKSEEELFYHLFFILKCKKGEVMATTPRHCPGFSAPKVAKVALEYQKWS